jgi:hypothetical protein
MITWPGPRSPYVLLALLLAPARVRAADCNRNGIEDGFEVLSGAARDCNANLIPDACEPNPGSAFRYAISRPDRGDSTQVSEIAFEDLDGDGIPERLVVEADEIRIERGLGRGVFTPSQSFPRRSRTYHSDSQATDVDGDGDPDLLVQHDSELLTFFNQGDGTLDEPLVLAATDGRYEFDFTLLDLEGDGDDDLASTGLRKVFLWRNDGTGSLEPLLPIPFDAAPVVLRSRDMDADGDIDLVAASYVDGGQSSRLSVHANDGQGRFPRAYGVDLDERVDAAALADVEGDGFPDVLACPSSAVLLARNRGGVSIDAPEVFYRLIGNEAIMARDLDGDALEDVVILSGTWGQLTTLWGDGSGGFADVKYALPTYFSRLAAGDAAGDAGIDLVTFRDLYPYGQRYEVIERTGPRSFGLPRIWDAPLSFHTMASADFNADGLIDVASLAGAGEGFILPGTGGGDLGPAVGLPEDAAGSFLHAADLDADGQPDLIVTGFVNEVLDGAARILWNDGETRFTSGEVLSLKRLPSGAAAGDWDRDGLSDLAFVHQSSADVLVFRNLGGRRFALHHTATGRVGAVGAAAGDIDGDGDLDLAAAFLPSDAAGLFTNDGAGRFPAFTRVPLGFRPGALVLAEIDGDGKTDLAAEGYLLGESDRIVRVYFNEGGGAFRERNSITFRHLQLDESPFLHATDVNLDGRADIIFGGGKILLNFGARGLSQVLDLRAGRMGGVGGQDFNADGILDLYIADGRYGRIRFFESRPIEGDGDGDGIVDACAGRLFHRGDPDGSGRADITDAIRLLGYLFLGEEAPACLEAADVDNSGAVEITDPLALLGYLFNGGPAPAAPGPPPGACGDDPDPVEGEGDLGCEGYTACAG